MARKFVIDTDVGMDDASAIFLATEAHKEGAIEMVAITAVHGNTSVDNVVNNIARTMVAADLNKVFGCHSIRNNDRSWLLSWIIICSNLVTVAVP